MKKVLFAAAVVAALSLTACNENMVIEAPVEDAISVSAFSPVPTKGTVLTGTSLNPYYTEFSVDAFYFSAGETFMNATLYDYTTKWYYKNDTDVKYWPKTGYINFYGLVPTSDAEFTKSVTKDAQTLTVTVPAENANQKDILVAQCLNAKKDDRNGDNATSTPNSGDVPMVFRHSLSQVNFAAKNTNANLTVAITGVKIVNANNKATVSFDGTTAELAGTATTYAAKLGAASYTLDATSESLMAADGHLILAPQSTDKWNLKTGAEDNDGARFVITASIVDATNVTIYSGDIYMPVDLNWEAGKNYIYTFVFGTGAGYDEDGNKVLDIITFDPSVADWTDVSGDITM